MEDNEIKEKVKAMFTKRPVSTELFTVCGHIYWLHEVDCADIEDAVKFMWTYAEIHYYKMNKEEFNTMISYVEYGLMHPMEKFNPDILGTEEHKLRFLAIELLVNIVCEIKYTTSDIFVIPVEDLHERIEMYKNNPKYKDMFTYQTQGSVFFKKFMEQYKKSIKPEDIKVDMEEVEKEYNINLNKIKDRDKRVRYRDIEMIDVDTKEVVATFESRQDCMDATGVSKSRLSQILMACKIQRNGIYQYNGWKSWKDKTNGKSYYFHETYKDDES